MQRSALVAAARRTPAVLTKAYPVDRQHVCFCGCPDGKHFGKGLFGVQQQRMFHEHLNLDSARNLIPQEFTKKDQVALWQESTKRDNALALSTSDEIESYVLNLVKSYFRTTKKASVSLDSKFADHGLDSLDVIELVIQVEDELNYLIDAEKLELFSKPRHFVNFIQQLEAYKTEHKRLPHEGIYADTRMRTAFPGIPGLS